MKKALFLMVFGSIALMSTIAGAYDVWGQNMAVEKDGTWYRTTDIYSAKTSFTTFELPVDDIDGVQCTIGYYDAETEITSKYWRYQLEGVWRKVGTYGSTSGGYGNAYTGINHSWCTQQSYYNNFDIVNVRYLFKWNFTYNITNEAEHIACFLN